MGPSTRFNRFLAIFAVLFSAVLLGPTSRSSAQGLHPAGSAADLVSDRGVPNAGEAPIPYVIVTSRELRPEFLHLARAREKNGIRSVVRSIESLRAAYPNAVDDPERVRTFLRDAHDLWGTSFVLLGGDTDVLPPRFVTTTSISGERRFVSDWYFACLDGTWDADGDGRYAEQSDPSSNDPGDNADVVPELSVGRAPVSTRAGARRFVDKTLAYEQRRDDGFENTALMFANQLLPGVLDFASLAEQILPLLADDPALQISRLYETFDNPAWVPGALPETPQAVLAALNRGANVTIGMGAGSPDLLEAGPRASPAPYLTTDDILSLSNGDRAGHVWLLTSLVGAFDHPISLAEAFLDAPAGGAVTVIAPSDLVFSNEGFTLVRRLAEVAFEEGVPSIGEALIQARAGMPVSAASLAPLSYQLLGDPMLRITSSSPVATAHGPDRGRTGILGATTPAGAEHDVPLVIRERTASVPPAPKAEAVQFALSHPSPSPCTQTARVVCTVPQQLAGAGLRVDVLDLSGRTVSTLMSERARGGTVSLAWDLRSDHGARVPAGVYFVRVAIGDVMRSVRLVVTD